MFYNCSVTSKLLYGVGKWHSLFIDVMIFFSPTSNECFSFDYQHLDVLMGLSVDIERCKAVNSINVCLSNRKKKIATLRFIE